MAPVFPRDVDIASLRPLLRESIGGDLHLYLSYHKGNFSSEHKAEHPNRKAVVVELPDRNSDLILRRLQTIYPVETGPATLGRKTYPLGIRLRFVAESTRPSPADRTTFNLLWIQQEIFLTNLIFQEVSSIVADIDIAPLEDYPDMTLQSVLMDIATPGCDDVKHYPLFQSIRFYPERRGEPCAIFTSLARRRKAKKRARHTLAGLVVFCRESWIDKDTACPFDQYFGHEYLAEADNMDFDTVNNRVRGKTTQCPSNQPTSGRGRQTCSDDPGLFCTKRQATQSPASSPEAAAAVQPTTVATTQPIAQKTSNPKKRSRTRRQHRNRKPPPTNNTPASTGDESAGMDI